ncbi:MarR family winged helix-turn-helix transcriptional regulator [Cryptosporangium aurantiacum]|uniref:DNA-binding transcriptional regulator, MarR family n=1 Tax=Cryptosporangium aurantiacum TaxID=134849 RepID=A0A1M7R113_9ACTN|nr:MarR family transcriptional regulator [Cryptosporangium aurantiacum]SHN38398.1 DNA-binding transcriptional regulator, MarR family [Cryptosporangium aurantiacum]
MPRRLPTREELAVWRDFLETTEALRTAVGARLHRDTGLSPGDYGVLLALSEADGNRLRSSDLATAVGWERSRLSHHLGRMERRGLIRRESSPTDNRGADVVLERVGADAFRAATVPHFKVIRELFVDALTPEQLDAARDVAAALRARLDKSI